MSNTPITREFIAERDLRIFRARQGGASHADIASRFGVTTRAVANSLSRQLGRLNSEAALAYPEVLRMELERLDQLQFALWGRTQPHKVVLDDGTEMVVEADIESTRTVLSIMDRRAKLLGMERTKIDVQVDQGDGIRSTLVGFGGQEVDADDPKKETLELVRLMVDVGSLDAEAGKALLLALENPGSEIIDVESIEIEGEIIEAEVMEETKDDE